MGEMTRRDFVRTAALTASGCALCGRQMLQAAAANTQPVAVGSLKDFLQDGVIEKYARANGFFLVRLQGKLYAMASLCTHRDNIPLNVKGTGEQLMCAEHGSRFSLEGTVVQGPAQRSLVRYAISVDAGGTVKVDTSRKFDEGQWGDEASFVRVS